MKEKGKRKNGGWSTCSVANKRDWESENIGSKADFIAVWPWTGHLTSLLSACPAVKWGGWRSRQRSLPAMNLSNTESDALRHLHTSLIRHLGWPSPRARMQGWADHGPCPLASERGPPACRPSGEDKRAHMGDATDLFASHYSPSPLPPCFFKKGASKVSLLQYWLNWARSWGKLLNEQKYILPQKQGCPHLGTHLPSRFSDCSQKTCGAQSLPVSRLVIWPRRPLGGAQLLVVQEDGKGMAGEGQARSSGKESLWGKWQEESWPSPRRSWWFLTACVPWQRTPEAVQEGRGLGKSVPVWGRPHPGKTESQMKGGTEGV